MARVSIFQSGDEATTSSGSIVTASFENEMTAAKQSQERWKFKKKMGGKKSAYTPIAFSFQDRNDILFLVRLIVIVSRR